jgi:hypothetical protein
LEDKEIYGKLILWVLEKDGINLAGECKYDKMRMDHCAVVML